MSSDLVQGFMNENMWNELASKLSIVSQSVSLKRKNDKPWDNFILQKYRRAKDKAWSDFDADPTKEKFSTAHEADNKYVKVKKSALTKYEKKITASLDENY